MAGGWTSSLLRRLLVGSPLPASTGTGIIAGAGAVLPPPLDTYLIVGIVWVAAGRMSYLGIRDDAGTKVTEFGFVSAGGFITSLFQTREDVLNEGTLKFTGDTINNYFYDNALVQFFTSTVTHSGGQTFMVGTPLAFSDNVTYGNAYMSFDGRDAGKGLKDAFAATSNTVVYNSAAEALCSNGAGVDYAVTFALKLGRRYEIKFNGHWDQNDSAGRAIFRIRKTNLAGSQLRTLTLVNGAANQRMGFEIMCEYEPVADETVTFWLTCARATGAANVRVLDFGTGDPCYGRIRDITDNGWVRSI